MDSHAPGRPIQFLERKNWCLIHHFGQVAKILEGFLIDHEMLTPEDINSPNLQVLFTVDLYANSIFQGAHCFSPLKPSEIPDHLASIVKDCGILLA